MGFIEEQIRKNIANRVAIEKSMGREFTESDCLDLLEKAGKAAQMGEVRTWNGKEYIKTPKGWRPKPKGYKEGEKKQEVTEARNPVGKPESVTPKKVTDQLKVGDRVMYNGKEMTLTRISKDGRFQNGIEMKFVNEGDSTPTGGKTLLGNMMYAKPMEKKQSERLLKKRDDLLSNVDMIERMEKRMEDLENLMWSGDANYDDKYEAEIEYDKLSGDLEKLQRKTKRGIVSFMKESNPDWKFLTGANSSALINGFKKEYTPKTKGR